MVDLKGQMKEIVDDMAGHSQQLVIQDDMKTLNRNLQLLETRSHLHDLRLGQISAGFRRFVSKEQEASANTFEGSDGRPVTISPPGKFEKLRCEDVSDDNSSSAADSTGHKDKYYDRGGTW